MIKVAKFGGCSVAERKQIKKVRHIMREEPSRRIAVVSAAGKRSPDDHKLTDLLYLCRAHIQYGVSCDEILHTIRERFHALCEDLGGRMISAPSLTGRRRGRTRNPPLTNRFRVGYILPGS